MFQSLGFQLPSRFLFVKSLIGHHPQQIENTIFLYLPNLSFLLILLVEKKIMLYQNKLCKILTKALEQFQLRVLVMQYSTRFEVREIVSHLRTLNEYQVLGRYYYYWKQGRGLQYEKKNTIFLHYQMNFQYIQTKMFCQLGLMDHHK